MDIISVLDRSELLYPTYQGEQLKYVVEDAYPDLEGKIDDLEPGKLITLLHKKGFSDSKIMRKVIEESISFIETITVSVGNGDKPLVGTIDKLEEEYVVCSDYHDNKFKALYTDVYRYSRNVYKPHH